MGDTGLCLSAWGETSTPVCSPRLVWSSTCEEAWDRSPRVIAFDFSEGFAETFDQRLLQGDWPAFDAVLASFKLTSKHKVVLAFDSKEHMAQFQQDVVETLLTRSRPWIECRYALWKHDKDVPCTSRCAGSSHTSLQVEQERAVSCERDVRGTARKYFTSKLSEDINVGGAFVVCFPSAAIRSQNALDLKLLYEF